MRRVIRVRPSSLRVLGSGADLPILCCPKRRRRMRTLPVWQILAATLAINAVYWVWMVWG